MLQETSLDLMGPLRRAAGERKGPVAQQRVGEVASQRPVLSLSKNMTHLTHPAGAGPLPLPPPMTRAERAFDVSTAGGGV